MVNCRFLNQNDRLFLRRSCLIRLVRLAPFNNTSRTDWNPATFSCSLPSLLKLTLKLVNRRFWGLVLRNMKQSDIILLILNFKLCQLFVFTVETVTCSSDRMMLRHWFISVNCTWLLWMPISSSTCKYKQRSWFVVRLGCIMVVLACFWFSVIDVSLLRHTIELV